MKKNLENKTGMKDFCMDASGDKSFTQDDLDMVKRKPQKRNWISFW